MLRAQKSDRKSLIHTLETEKRPRMLAKLLNDNNIARIAVHPSYHLDPAIEPDEGSHVRTYELNLTALFSTHADFESAFFLFESPAAALMGWSFFSDHGSPFSIKDNLGYSKGGSIFDSRNFFAASYGASLPDLNDVEKPEDYSERNGKNKLFMKIKDLLRRSQGVLVVGAYETFCVRRACRDIAEIIEKLNLELPFLALNSTFCLS